MRTLFCEPKITERECAFCVLKNRNMDLGIILHNDTLVVDSLTVADVFNKEHKRVLRDIRKRIDELENLEFNGGKIAPVAEIALDSYFAEGEYTDPKGEIRPIYYMTQKGFTLLVMGYTGQRALEYKVAYIEQFEQMKKVLAGYKSLDEPNSYHLVNNIRECLASAEIIIQPKDDELGRDYFAIGIYGLLRYYGYEKAISLSYIRSIRPKVMEIGLATFEEIVNYCAVKDKLKPAYLKATMQDWHPSEVGLYMPPVFGVSGLLTD